MNEFIWIRQQKHDLVVMHKLFGELITCQNLHQATTFIKNYPDSYLQSLREKHYGKNV